MVVLAELPRRRAELICHPEPPPQVADPGISADCQHGWRGQLSQLTDAAAYLERIRISRYLINGADGLPMTSVRPRFFNDHQDAVVAWAAMLQTTTRRTQLKMAIMEPDPRVGHLRIDTVLSPFSRLFTTRSKRVHAGVVGRGSIRCHSIDHDVTGREHGTRSGVANLEEWRGHAGAGGAHELRARRADAVDSRARR